MYGFLRDYFGFFSPTSRRPSWSRPIYRIDGKTIRYDTMDRIIHAKRTGSMPACIEFQPQRLSKRLFSDYRVSPTVVHPPRFFPFNFARPRKRNIFFFHARSVTRVEEELHMSDRLVKDKR